MTDPQPTREAALRFAQGALADDPGELDEEWLADLLTRFAAQHSIAAPEINTPEIEDFIIGALTEAQHQRARWGEAHDRSKSAENWYWLVGYLSGKALRASIQGDREKALHHTISAAAALSQWHDAIKHDASGSGVGEDADLQPAETAPTDQHSTAAPDLTLAAYRREIAELQDDNKRLRERLMAPSPEPAPGSQ